MKTRQLARVLCLSAIVASPLSARSATGQPRATAAVPVEIAIPDGTEIRLRLVRPLSSASAQPEQRVDLETLEDIVVDGHLVIAKGAQAWGLVATAQKKKSFGRRGKLEFSIDYVKSADGQNLRLRSTREARGDDSYGKAGVVTLLVGPFGALVKGKDIEVPAGTQYSIFIDGDRTVRLSR